MNVFFSSNHHHFIDSNNTFWCQMFVVPSTPTYFGTRLKWLNLEPQFWYTIRIILESVINLLYFREWFCQTLTNRRIVKWRLTTIGHSSTWIGKDVKVIFNSIQTHSIFNSTQTHYEDKSCESFANVQKIFSTKQHYGYIQTHFFIKFGNIIEEWL